MRRFLIFALAAALLPVSAGAANVVVPVLELATDGAWDPDIGSFVLRTRFASDIVIHGGSKFAASLRLSLLANHLEKTLANGAADFDDSWDQDAADALNDAAFIGVSSVALMIPSLFGLPVSTTYFAGYLDQVASGSDYPELFGRKNPSTSVQGYTAFPDGIGGDRSRWYDGIHSINGTGIRLGVRALDGDFAGYLYGYMDGNFSFISSGIWSVDARGVFAFGRSELEGFVGGSGTIGPYGVYRAGLLFHYDSEGAGEFFLQAGVPMWDPTKPLLVEDLYLLFEPRVRFGSGAVILTFFHHPSVYQQNPTTEGGMLNAALDLRFGDMETGGPQGGVRTLVSFDPGYDAPPSNPALDRPNSVSLSIVPYIDFSVGGIGWGIRLPVNIFPIEGPWYSLFNPLIAAKASF
ncbi:MAG: hypothetical protein JXA15_02685 [Spirochaetales bacterium]|nr:hypothetical protein [Spirochaetales bacterium]